MFIDKKTAFELIETYGSPLYVYDETILRKRCNELKNLLPGLNLQVNYSIKANSNPHLLKIVLDEGLNVDAMSPGEIYVEELAGFTPDRIFYIGNNVSAEEMKYAIDRDILVSVDSLSQLELYGKINAGGRVAVRFNPGFGAGHHEKVVTAGKNTKFGVQAEFVDEVKTILQKHALRLVGINQHIGSLFLDEDEYINGVKGLLEIIKQFPGLEFIDFGGGFGVPYKKSENRLDLLALSEKLSAVLNEFLHEYDNKEVVFKIEPGRYIAAECGILLGQVYSIKQNYDKTYIGTDLGMNVLVRPSMYDSYHEVEVLSKKEPGGLAKQVTVVGNICETGDIMAKERLLPEIHEGDILAVLNAGAYGHVMSTNYNFRLRPAEVLITESGAHRLIRKRDSFEDLVRNYCV
ncbi:diaminopimelate decarboxylase [Desulfitibacter alkalitolerans]|uniref:diaminopimelate decarboxylase n=1 Tax=Desulfitibacter alkalitolerans TaxID=264641 RepID=UPI000551592B|nr:diaminopimelate decarboxylase [Desulfitibacter alkalitolerans]